MQIVRYILLPFSLLYGTILWLRNKLFDWKLKSVTEVDTTVISVGNLSVGGTGKSPHVEWIADQLREDFSVAILSRGYGRKSKGFVRVLGTSKSVTVGDEALFYKTKLEESVEVAVCEKRVEGAERLLQHNPSIDAIVLDDAYQHRYIKRDVNILLTDFNQPFYKDFVLPSGRLREFRSGKSRADIVIVTKCPDSLEQKQKEQVKRQLKLQDSVEVFFSRVIYGALVPFGSASTFELPDTIILVTGIANPKPLENHLSKIAKVESVCFNDHHDFTTSDIRRVHKLFDTFAKDKTCIVTTSKDYVRLKNSVHEKVIRQYPWFYQEITVDIDEEQQLLEKIKLDVRKNK